MNCEFPRTSLHGYLDGELDEGLKRTLESHLTYCNHCHAVYDSTRKTIELYCDGKLFSLPEEVRTRLHAALKHKLQKHS